MSKLNPIERRYLGADELTGWRLKLYVVIARVRPQHAKLGGRVFLEETVEGRRYQIPAEVVKLPFFDPQRKKEILS